MKNFRPPFSAWPSIRGPQRRPLARSAALSFPRTIPLQTFSGRPKSSAPAAIYPHMPEGSAGIVRDLRRGPVERYLLDDPAGEYGEYPYGLAYSAGEDVANNGEVETLAKENGFRVEWADSPDEYEDGGGVWPFRLDEA